MKQQMKQRMNGYLRAGLLLGGVLTALIVLGFFWTPYDPNAMGDAGEKFLAPSFQHLLGTDDFGRDIFSRVLKGAGTTFCIALATVLSFVTLYKMPQGGTITLASMLPIFLFSYAYGVGPGMLVGAAYGFVQFLQGGLYFVHPIELLLDYPLAFAMLGLAGLANKFSDKWGMIPGIILGTFGRFVCAFLSGMIFFGMYAPEGQNLVVYSIVYNGLYLVPEAIICIVLALIPQIRQLAKRLALQD